MLFIIISTPLVVPALYRRRSQIEIDLTKPTDPGPALGLVALSDGEPVFTSPDNALTSLTTVKDLASPPDYSGEYITGPCRE
jgi:hypothetical protein